MAMGRELPFWAVTNGGRGGGGRVSRFPSPSGPKKGHLKMDTSGFLGPEPRDWLVWGLIFGGLFTPSGPFGCKARARNSRQEKLVNVWGLLPRLSELEHQQKACRSRRARPPLRSRAFGAQDGALSCGPVWLRGNEKGTSFFLNHHSETQRFLIQIRFPRFQSGAGFRPSAAGLKGFKGVLKGL